MSPYLTVDDLAERWHSTPHAVRDMRSKGQLPPATRIGKRLLWDVADIEAFEAGRRENQPVRDRSTPGPGLPRAAWPAKKDYSGWGKSA